MFDQIHQHIPVLRRFFSYLKIKSNVRFVCVPECFDWTGFAPFDSLHFWIGYCHIFYLIIASVIPIHLFICYESKIHASSCSQRAMLVNRVDDPMQRKFWLFQVHNCCCGECYRDRNVKPVRLWRFAGETVISPILSNSNLYTCVIYEFGWMIDSVQWCEQCFVYKLDAVSVRLLWLGSPTLCPSALTYFSLVLPDSWN